MGRIYGTIAVFLFSFFLSEAVYRLSKPEYLREKKTFSHVVRQSVVPDRVVMRLARAEPFGEGAAAVLKEVGNPLVALRQELKGRDGFTVRAAHPVMKTTHYASAAGVAAAYDGALVADVEVHDVGLIPDLTKKALELGFNRISLAEQTASGKLWASARSQAIEAARAEIRPRIDEAAAALGIKVRACTPPKKSIEIAVGEGSGSGGLAGSGDHPDVVPVESVLRPLKTLIIPEPAFEGVVDVAQSVSLKPVEVTGKVELQCEFAI